MCHSLTQITSNSFFSFVFLSCHNYIFNYFALERDGCIYLSLSQSSVSVWVFCQKKRIIIFRSFPQNHINHSNHIQNQPKVISREMSERWNWKKRKVTGLEPNEQTFFSHYLWLFLSFLSFQFQVINYRIIKIDFIFSVVFFLSFFLCQA